MNRVIIAMFAWLVSNAVSADVIWKQAQSKEGFPKFKEILAEKGHASEKGISVSALCQMASNHAESKKMSMEAPMAFCKRFLEENLVIQYFDPQDKLLGWVPDSVFLAGQWKVEPLLKSVAAAQSPAPGAAPVPLNAPSTDDRIAEVFEKMDGLSARINVLQKKLTLLTTRQDQSVAKDEKRDDMLDELNKLITDLTLLQKSAAERVSQLSIAQSTDHTELISLQQQLTAADLPGLSERIDGLSTRFEGWNKERLNGLASNLIEYRDTGLWVAAFLGVFSLVLFFVSVVVSKQQSNRTTTGGAPLGASGSSRSPKAQVVQA